MSVENSDLIHPQRRSKGKAMERSVPGDKFMGAAKFHLHNHSKWNPSYKNV